ncbi:hypothetical protein [Microcoleus sp. B9-D4]|uniref:hypothetical protein n=1 Tax=Microcoleus sp. B9-D4 TaxID=2818711 RepID=UPI002FD3CBE5
MRLLTRMSPGLAIGMRRFFHRYTDESRAPQQIAFGQIIVDKHRGKITVNSVPSEGAEFAIAIFVQ